MHVSSVLAFFCVLSNIRISLGICSQSKHENEFGFWLKCSNTSLTQALDQGNGSLSAIVISQSNIPKIPSHAFTKFATTLVALNLHACGIRSVSSQAFKDLTHLRKLSLSNNNITEVHSEWFAGLTWLEQVDLSFNNIKTISTEAFAEMANVHMLNINYNEMSCLTVADSFAKMKSLEKIRIDGNPWKINCRAKMTRWFYDKRINYNGDSRGVLQILDELLWLCIDEEPGISESEKRMKECVAVFLLNQFRSAAQTSESYTRAGLQCTRERDEYATCVRRNGDKRIITNGDAVKMILSGLWAKKSS